MDNFNRAMEFIFKWEGFRSDHPADPGGLTVLGLASKYFPDEVSRMSGLPEAQARGIAREVYRREFWDKCGCALLPYPLDIIVMDTAVNMGAYHALKLKERSADWRDYLLLRIERYLLIGAARPQFLRGWINRAVDLYRTVSADGHPISAEYKE